MSNSERPTNVEVLDFIKSDALAQSIIKNGEANTEKRQIAIRALEIAANQLGRDAERIEEEVFSGTVPVREGYEKVELSKALRIAQSWLTGMVQSANTPDGMEKHP